MSEGSFSDVEVKCLSITAKAKRCLCVKGWDRCLRAIMYMCRGIRVCVEIEVCVCVFVQFLQ